MLAFKSGSQTPERFLMSTLKDSCPALSKIFESVPEPEKSSNSLILEW